MSFRFLAQVDVCCWLGLKLQGPFYPMDCVPSAGRSMWLPPIAPWHRRSILASWTVPAVPTQSPSHRSRLYGGTPISRVGQSRSMPYALVRSALLSHGIWGFESLKQIPTRWQG